MSWSILLLIQMSVGALIGGITNELAIRMLFRPYKPVYIGKWRVPFTPGLIPKRHAELAQQMGKLVEDFLITPAGVRKMLQKGNFDQEIQRWLLQRLNDLEASDETVATFLSKWGIELSSEVEDLVKQRTALFLAQTVSKYSYSTLEDVLPEELKLVIEEKVEEAAPFLLDKMGQYLSSNEGSSMVRDMLSQLAGGLGMLGGFATMLLSDEKIITKVSQYLENALRNEELKERVGALLVKEWRGLYKKQMGEVIQWVGEERIEKVIHYLVDRSINFERLGSKKLGNFIGPIIPYVKEAIPGVVRRLFEWIETNLEEGLQKLNLTRIAANEVEAFPVNKLEEMILHITGKELKMITVFGAVLGGLIGLIQGLLVMFSQ